MTLPEVEVLQLIPFEEDNHSWGRTGSDFTLAIDNRLVKGYYLLSKTLVYSLHLPKGMTKMHDYKNLRIKILEKLYEKRTLMSPEVWRDRKGLLIKREVLRKR